MVPTYFLLLRALPTTPNGKADKAYLHRLQAELGNEDEMRYALTDMEANTPLGGTEIALRSLWTEVLGIPAHAIVSSSDLVALGGNSLHGMQLVATARKQGFELSFQAIIDQYRLSDMAARGMQLQAWNTITTETSKQRASHSATSSVESILLAASACQVPVEDIEDIFSCSVTQEEIMGASLANVGSYVLQNIYQRAADVDIGQSSCAWNKVGEMFDILRTRIIFGSETTFNQVIIRTYLSVDRYPGLERTPWRRCAGRGDPNNVDQVGERRRNVIELATNYPYKYAAVEHTVI